jgi:hypothetical protein
VQGDSAMEAITKIMQAIGAEIEAVGALAERATGEIQAAGNRGQGAKAALVITNRFANELKDPAARLEAKGQEYVATLSDLDAGMQVRFDLLSEGADSPSDEAVEFLHSVEELAATADKSLNELQGLVTTINSTAKISRSLRAPVRTMRTGLQAVLDGRAIIADWGRRAASLQTDQDG